MSGIKNENSISKTQGAAQAAEGRWERLTIANDFVFCKVMSNPDLCREVLEAVLGVRIERIEYVHDQETVAMTPESKGVRLDVYVRDGGGAAYDVEMQAYDTRELPQRARYYHALMALGQLRRGQTYRSLRDSYAIFVCKFDPFGRGRGVYRFRNLCEGEPGLPLGDGAETVFLAATGGGANDAGGRVGELLDYVATGRVAGSLSARLDAEVEKVLGNEDWRAEYMFLWMRDELNYERGRDEGREQGLEQGRLEGGRDAVARLAELSRRLEEDGSPVDFGQVLADESLREDLCRRYGI
jgi:predicted transposase/invertase (TIGR01784 family)